ncbi:MAG: hypothetical protein JWP45_3030 [Mucilaginibacter sp.]|nr:hypothetical protein [Mucilaginibacter sp.]MDB5140804.1 hypothetical protein [Mucilaginibacter sp.]
MKKLQGLAVKFSKYHKLGNMPHQFISQHIK